MNPVILALMPFVVVAEHGAVGYICRDPRVGHGGCSVSTSLSSGSDVALTVLALLRLSLVGSSTLLLPIWRIDTPPGLTGTL